MMTKIENLLKKAVIWLLWVGGFIFFTWMAFSTDPKVNWPVRLVGWGAILVFIGRRLFPSTDSWDKGF